MVDDKEKDVCDVCERLHGKEDPCPRRIAYALMMHPRSIERLTQTDKNWMAAHLIHVTDILEEELADRMDIISPLDESEAEGGAQ